MNKIKKIPYGITDFAAIRAENYYYVDKTRFIKDIENSSKYLFLIRPRRFGKSLWTVILDAYYSEYYKDSFNKWFGGLDIGKNPTESQGKYLILKFNFSAVNPDIDKVEQSFNAHCDMCYMFYHHCYKHYFDVEYFNEFKKLENTNQKLEYIYFHAKKRNLKLFIIIDEYDNFANTILSSYGKVEYKKLTHGEGFFRHFFNKLKVGTTDMNAPIARLFITGVSPLTMDDVTSGFNIGENISTLSEYNQMVGFTESEVVEMIEYYKKEGKINIPTSELIKIMQPWYNNYHFAETDTKPMYNSNMVLFFIKHLISTGKIPTELIDMNVRIDYKKFHQLIVWDKQLNGNFSKLKEVTDKGEINAKLYSNFSVNELTNPDKFVSLLFYFGLLTICGQKEGKPLLKIPNETMKTLWSEYISKAYNESGVFKIDTYKYENLIGDMAYRADWKAVFSFLTDQINKQTKIRDYINGDAMIKGFLLAYLNLTDHYTIHTKKEMNKGFADFYLEPFTILHTEIPYSYLIEVKYMKRSDKKPTENQINTLISEATEQLNKYENDEFVQKTKAHTKILKLALVYSGWELVGSSIV